MTPVEAFELAIELALTAPDEERAALATKHAEEISISLTKEQVSAVLAKYEAAA